MCIHMSTRMSIHISIDMSIRMSNSVFVTSVFASVSGVYVCGGCIPTTISVLRRRCEAVSVRVAAATNLVLVTS